MDIWIIGTLNQQFIRDFIINFNFQKSKVVSGKTPFFSDKSIFIPSILFVLTLAFRRAFLGILCSHSTFNYKPVLLFFEKGFSFSENLFQS